MSPGILDKKMHLFLATSLTSGEMALEQGEEIRRKQPRNRLRFRERARPNNVGRSKKSAASSPALFRMGFQRIAPFAAELLRT
jgi:hypothetical protein